MTEPTASKIKGFGSLKAGWHFGEGDSINDSVLDRSLAYLEKTSCQGKCATDAFPGLAGEVMVTAYSGAWYLEAILRPDRLVEMRLEKAGAEIMAATMPWPEAYRRAHAWTDRAGPSAHDRHTRGLSIQHL